jgi:hypothetical protein
MNHTSRLIKPPFVRNGEHYFPEITEEDLESDSAIVPLTKGMWYWQNERLGWIDLDASLEWLESGDCSLNELYMLSKMLDAVHCKGRRTKRIKEMLLAKAVINQHIVAVCKRLRAKGQYQDEQDEKSNVVKFNKN